MSWPLRKLLGCFLWKLRNPVNLNSKNIPGRYFSLRARAMHLPLNSFLWEQLTFSCFLIASTLTNAKNSSYCRNFNKTVGMVMVGTCKKGIFSVKSYIIMLRPQARASFVSNRFLAGDVSSVLYTCGIAKSEISE